MPVAWSPAVRPARGPSALAPCARPASPTSCARPASRAPASAPNAIVARWSSRRNCLACCRAITAHAPTACRMPPPLPCLRAAAWILGRHVWPLGFCLCRFASPPKSRHRAFFSPFSPSEFRFDPRFTKLTSGCVFDDGFWCFFTVRRCFYLFSLRVPPTKR